MPAMSEMKTDMEALKKKGFNLVKLQEQWQTDEPVEGKYGFSRYEELIEYAAKLDMGVYLGFTCEQAPHWLWEKHPGCRMIGRDGRPVAYEAQIALPADGKPGPCFDHPGAAADMCRFLTMAVKTLGRFENVLIWNTWQEIGYWSDWLAGNSVCFCDHTLAHFRSWLNRHFGDLNALNRSWNTRYDRFEDIIPTRTINARGPFAVDIAWQFFMDNVQIPAMLKVRALAIRAADVLKRPVFAHKGSPAFAAGQDWAYARSQDFLGVSCYPAWGPGHAWDDGQPAHGEEWDRHRALLAEMWNCVAYRCDYTRSSNPKGAPVWAAEFQGGPISTGFHKGRVPSADDMRRWMLSAMGAGATAISFWVSRAEIQAGEQNGFGLLDSEGTSSERLEEAGRVGRALDAQADIFAQPTLEPAKIGIIVDEWNFQTCQTLAQGGGNLDYDVRGWYRLLWDAGIPVDFVEISYEDSASLAKYRALVLPFPLAMTDENANRLSVYVKNGGNLISEAAPGRLTETGFARRGEIAPALRELFGVSMKNFTMVREPDKGMRWSFAPRTWGEYLDASMLEGAGALKNHRIRANVYIETFNVADAKPCLEYGSDVAGVVRSAGSGNAWLLGTYIGHNGTAHRDKESAACVRAILKSCGVEPAHKGALLLRKRVTEKKEAWLFTNPTNKTVTERISIKGWKKAADLLGAKLVKERSSANLTVKPLDVRVLIVEK
jgi:beta-galactosidase GanA